MQAPGNCVFCRLIAGEIEASVVHEDPPTVAFMDIQPLTPGHVLVAPAATPASWRILIPTTQHR